ncbi:hypothetical protein BKA62DRAFT_704124 [Auriculariales sp. MPI-PUGE-AT-0066]|nr:hypothetical protein BKA62DRAFT_704124 [Auriculariales sp. MPI-PUGE-AT-0066]
MLTADHRAALELTTDEVYLNVARNIGASDAAAFNDLATEIINHVRLTLALHMRKRNQDNLTLCNRLPVELWEIIWLQLSAKERIQVSHVSSYWRSNALSCPSLWSSIPYTSPAPYSLALVQAFLERSRGAPFDLDLNVENVTEHTFFELSNIILPHYERLANIQAKTHDIASFEGFLRPFTILPSLRHLGLSSHVSMNTYLERAEPLSLPNLSSLIFNDRVTCGDAFGFSCPTASSVMSMFNTSGHVLRLLRACPAATTWNLQVGSRPATTAEGDMDELHDLLLAAQVQSLHIVRAYRVDIEPCLKMFAQAQIPHFDITFGSSEGINTEDFDRYFMRNDEQLMLNNLECVQLPQGHFSAKVSLEGNAGLLRRSICLLMDEDSAATFRESMINVSRILVMSSVTQVRISNSYWLHAFHSEVEDTARRSTMAYNIIVEFDDGDFNDVNEWMASCAEAEQLPLKFVRLEQLTLKAGRATPSLTVSDTFVANFNRVFGADRLLHKLVIEGLKLSVDVASLIGTLAVEVELLTSTRQIFEPSGDI